MRRFGLLFIFLLSAGNATEEVALEVFGSVLERFMHDEPNPNDLFYFPENQDTLKTLIIALSDNAIPNANSAPRGHDFVQDVTMEIQSSYDRIKMSLDIGAGPFFSEYKKFGNNACGGTALGFGFVGYGNPDVIYWDVSWYNETHAGQAAIDRGGKGKTAQEIIMDLAPGLKPESPVQLPDDI